MRKLLAGAAIALASMTKTKGSMEVTVEGAKAPLQPLLIPEELLQALPLQGQLLQQRTPRSPTRGCFCHGPQL